MMRPQESRKEHAVLLTDRTQPQNLPTNVQAPEAVDWSNAQEAEVASCSNALKGPVKPTTDATPSMTHALLKPNERIDQLIREHIQIIQSPDVFSFSLDAVLLAEFAQVPHHRKAKIVDLCAGNGAVSFFLTAKTVNPIIGVELQETLVDMARRTTQLNHLEDRLTWIHGDVRQVHQWIAKDSVDAITCNPPYFKLAEQSLKNKREAYTIARHEVYLPLSDLLQAISGLLKMKGKAYLVHRPDRLSELLSLASAHRLEAKRLQFVHPKAEKEANMVLIELMKDGASGVRVLPPITVFGEDGQYGPYVRSVLYGEEAAESDE